MKINLSRFRYMNGLHLYEAFKAGASRILEREQHLNRINVFPVPDGDTGSNLAYTLRHILQETRPEKSFKNMVQSLSRSALVAARGNSGIIFAQFLYGFSHKIKNEHAIDVRQFSHLVQEGCVYASKAMEKPVEGTIITVIREWGNSLDALKEKTDDYLRLLANALKTAQKTLQKTPEKLAILKKNHVVDAGAQGFVYFLEGIMDFLRRGKIKKLPKSQSPVMEQVVEAVADEDASHFRYCVETVVQGDDLRDEIMREKLRHLGDSLVIAGGEGQFRIHIHTDQPADFFYRLQALGRLKNQKIDDMVRQQQVRSHRKWPIALVTDSLCDLPEEIMEKYQVQMIPARIHFGEDTFFDKVTIKPDHFYQLLSEREDRPTTSYPTFNEFESLYSFLLTHYDSIIAVHMSAQLSGTWNASHQVAARLSRETGKKISVFDSHHLSGTLGLLVWRAAMAIEQGRSHDEILQLLREWQQKTRILVSAKTLKNFVRSGRISRMKGFIANLLNLKPIISLDENGKTVLFDKAFSQRGNIKKVLKTIDRSMRENKVWKYSLLHAHDPQGIEWYARQIKRVLGKEPEFILDISPAIGLHAGLGAAAIALMFE